MKRLISFAMRNRTLLVILAVVAVIAVIVIAGGAPDIFSP